MVFLIKVTQNQGFYFNVLLLNNTITEKKLKKIQILLIINFLQKKKIYLFIYIWIVCVTQIKFKKFKYKKKKEKRKSISVIIIKK